MPACPYMTHIAMLAPYTVNMVPGKCQWKCWQYASSAGPCRALLQLALRCKVNVTNSYDHDLRRDVYPSPDLHHHHEQRPQNKNSLVNQSVTSNVQATTYTSSVFPKLSLCSAVLLPTGTLSQAWMAFVSSPVPSAFGSSKLYSVTDSQSIKQHKPCNLPLLPELPPIRSTID